MHNHFIVILLVLSYSCVTFVYTLQNTLTNSNSQKHFGNRIIRTDQQLQINKYSLNERQHGGERDLMLSEEMPVLDTLISSGIDQVMKSTLQSKSRSNSHQSSNDFGKNDRHNNDKNKISGHQSSQSSNLLDPYWSNSNTGNIFDIGWDPIPQRN
ncbi:unnamed protein product [Heterobilharzia americana]|nr:unnamed protein product [Heterobilharzia americana]